MSNEKAYYGQFGGQYVSESLMNTLAEVDAAFEEAIHDPEFLKQYHYYLKQYVGRETPLYYAERLSEKYGTRIYLKREDLNHTGAHKINNVIGQILLAKRMGKTKVIAETGAGQHGVATATGAALFNMDCTVYMGAEDIERQKLNVMRMEMLGATVVPVHSGSNTLKDATASIRAKVLGLIIGKSNPHCMAWIKKFSVIWLRAGSPKLILLTPKQAWSPNSSWTLRRAFSVSTA